MILTETQLQDYVHSLYEGDTATPDSTEDDYLVRRNYINMGIGFWENWRGTKWNELYTTLADDSTGADTTVATNDTQSDCPTNLVDTLGFVQIKDGSGGATNYKQVDQDESQLFINSAASGSVYWITGTPGSYKINWYPTIDSSLNGRSIAYPFYKRATLVSSTSDTPEPGDHEFLVHYVLNWLYKEDNPGMAREHLDIAINLINNMKLMNDREKPYQDRSLYDKTSSGFGT